MPFSQGWRENPVQRANIHTAPDTQQAPGALSDAWLGQHGPVLPPHSRNTTTLARTLLLPPIPAPARYLYSGGYLAVGALAPCCSLSAYLPPNSWHTIDVCALCKEFSHASSYWGIHSPTANLIRFAQRRKRRPREERKDMLMLFQHLLCARSITSISSPKHPPIAHMWTLRLREGQRLVQSHTVRNCQRLSASPGLSDSRVWDLEQTCTA